MYGLEVSTFNTMLCGPKVSVTLAIIALAREVVTTWAASGLASAARIAGCSARSRVATPEPAQHSLQARIVQYLRPPAGFVGGGASRAMSALVHDRKELDVGQANTVPADESGRLGLNYQAVQPLQLVFRRGLAPSSSRRDRNRRIWYSV